MNNKELQIVAYQFAHDEFPNIGNLDEEQILEYAFIKGANFFNNHEKIRKQLWCNVWASVANAPDCKSELTPTKYADEALKQFDKRFEK